MTVKKPSPEKVIAELPAHFYTSWLFSESLIKRSFAVMGHYIIAYLCVVAVLLVIGLTFAVVFGVGEAIFG